MWCAAPLNLALPHPNPPTQVKVLFLLLGIPFGIAFRRPAWATLGVVFAVWGAQRLADHFAVLVGAEIAAAAPLVLMLGALSYAWTRFGRTL